MKILTLILSSVLLSGCTSYGYGTYMQEVTRDRKTVIQEYRPVDAGHKNCPNQAWEMRQARKGVFQCADQPTDQPLPFWIKAKFKYGPADNYKPNNEYVVRVDTLKHCKNIMKTSVNTIIIDHNCND